MAKKDKIPRYRILLQDEVTGIQIAAGTDNMALFTKTDLEPMLKHFKEQISKVDPIDIELVERENAKTR